MQFKILKKNEMSSLERNSWLIYWCKYFKYFVCMHVGGYNRPLHAELAIQAILGCPHLLLNYVNKVISETKRDKSISVKLIK